MTTFGRRIRPFSVTAVLSSTVLVAAMLATPADGATTASVARIGGAPSAVPVAAAAGPSRVANATRLLLNFDTGAVGQPVTTVANVGSAGTQLTAHVVTNGAGGARATLATGRPGQANALRLPAYSATQSSTASPFAAVRVLDASISAGDLLDPGTHPFSFGADFALNAGETGPTSGANDNGNNLIQRGLTPPVGSRSATQYKIQVDHRVPSCALIGVAGGVQKTVVLKITADPKFPGTVGTNWYRATCARTSATSATFTLVSYNAAGAQAASYAVTAAVPAALDLTTANRATPLSVGGKLSASGVPANGSRDQFNGLVDHAVLQID